MNGHYTYKGPLKPLIQKPTPSYKTNRPELVEP